MKLRSTIVCTIIVTVVVVSILACVFMLLESKNLAMQCADREASLRLLSEFQLKFNNEAGILPDKYRMAVEKFVSANPDFWGLQHYRDDVADAEKKVGGVKTLNPQEQTK